MRNSPDTTATILGLSVGRAEAIKAILMPRVPFSMENPDPHKPTLRDIVKDHPDELVALGLVKQQVYAPYCIDVATGVWSVRPVRIWIDKESGVPLDSDTVRLIDGLPSDASLSNHHELLPPTYFTVKGEAERLAAILQEAGPSRNWPGPSSR